MLPGWARLKGLAGRAIQLSRTPRLALFEAHRLVVSPVARDALATVAAAGLRLRRGLSYSLTTDPIDSEGAARLRDDGLVRLPRLLSPAQVGEIMEWLEPHQVCSFYHPQLGSFHPRHAPVEAHLGEYDPGTILAAPYLLRLANEPGILSMVERFLGAKPTISNLSLWWSFPRPYEAREAQLFHRDVDDLRFCKLFVYLTDVTMDSGPHVFVHGSPHDAKCTRIRRYGDDEVKEAFGETAIEHLCGKAGDSFIANTAGVHKGLQPRNERRLLFQAEYSLFPVLSSQYRPISVPEPGFAADSYINRLFLS